MSRPWMKFYPADWQADQALGLCTLAARGLWVEMLAIMHKADPYGHLLVNGRAPTDVQLAALARCPPDQIPGLLDELENAGVFSKTRNRTIYSRRMAKDEKRRKDGQIGKITEEKVPGSRRSQAIEKARVKSATLKVVDKVVAMPPSTLDTRVQNLERKKEPPPPPLPGGGNGIADPPDDQAVEEGTEADKLIEFEAFYRAYPRREDRGHAEKAYAKARKLASAETLLEGARRYAVEQAGVEKKYIALPATWLHGKRWLDEPDKRRLRRNDTAWGGGILGG